MVRAMIRSAERKQSTEENGHLIKQNQNLCVIISEGGLTEVVKINNGLGQAGML